MDAVLVYVWQRRLNNLPGIKQLVKGGFKRIQTQAFWKGQDRDFQIEENKLVIKWLKAYSLRKCGPLW